MRFTLEIELGNEAMLEPWNVSDAIDAIRYPLNFAEGDGAVIRDVNGNTVGKWEVSK